MMSNIWFSYLFNYLTVKSATSVFVGFFSQGAGCVCVGGRVGRARFGAVKLLHKYMYNMLYNY